ncbi:MAG: hypothetical protein XD69_0789 [Clostridia bacterium 62_21]|nr:MAG: hypothetical protein XD69_0789 [Clostridia bacterium 62_21]
MGNTGPDLPGDDHRPSGAPRAREVKSQKAQLRSEHGLPGNKAVKVGMKYKTGAKPPEERQT